MTIGEIRNEALRLMGVSDTDVRNISAGSSGIHPDGDYISMTVGSIARCISDIENRLILPRRTAVLDLPFAVEDGIASIDINDIPDIFRIIGVSARSGTSYRPCVDFAVDDDNTILIPDYDSEGSYRLIYYPSVPRPSEISPESFELSVPDSIASLIPYYLVGDIYVGDEPGIASFYRSFYEKGLSLIKESTFGYRRRPSGIYRQ